MVDFKRRLLLGSAIAALGWRKPVVALTRGAYGTLPPVPTPASIAGLTSWSDAGGGGSPAAVTSLSDLSGNSRPLTVNASGTSITGMTPLGAIVMDRTVGLLSGLRMEYDATTNVAAALYPYYDPSGTFSVAGLTNGSASASTTYLVFSRGNLAQTRSGSFSYTTGSIPVLNIGTQVIVGITNNGRDGTTKTTDTLTLFPGTAQAVTISATMTQRFTRSLTLVNSGTTTDVYLDDTKVVTAATNASYSAGTLYVGSTFDLHELATYGSALNSTNLGVLLTNASSASKRWTRGPRKSYMAVMLGQSNANHFCGGDVGFTAAPFGVTTMAKTLRWTLGAICAMPASGFGYYQVGAIRGGNPFYDIVTPSNPYPWYAYDSANPPSTWALASASIGGSVINFQTWPTNYDANGAVLSFIWMWTETDSGQDPYTQQSNYQAARIRAYGQSRTAYGLTAAQFPMFEISMLPFNVTQSPGNGQGYFIRQSIDAIVATGATNNANYCIGNTADSLPNGATLNADGTITGGDTAHRAVGDLIAFAYKIGMQVGCSLIAQGLGEYLTSVPAGFPKSNGPKVTAATVTAANTVQVTIAADGNTALLAANAAAGSQAANGIGWQIMVGGSLASPGTIYAASAATVIDATHLSLTFPGMGSPSAGYLVFYGGYGMVGIGPNSAVYGTSITWPTGWDPSAFSASAPVRWPVQYCNALVGA